MATIKVKDSNGNWTVSPIIHKDSVYSTTEQIIGQWIDGKPIYRKVVDFGYLPNATSKTVAHGISNFDMLTSVQAIATQSAAWGFSIPFIGGSNISTGNSVTVWLDGTNVLINSNNDRSSLYCYVIIEYTKTTD